jgi:aryl-alcohol dehydrogenase-like predicted oxidoreductase
LVLPRFTEENFPKNLALANKITAIAQRLNTTPGEVALAWILAENPDSKPFLL